MPITLITINDLLDAWLAFRVGKRQRGDVQHFERNLEDNLFALHDAITNRQYRHAPYISFYIRDPRVRHIHKATVRDRIVHHVLYKKLSSVLDPMFIADSYSSRIDKGTHRAVRRLRSFTRKVSQTDKQCWALKCDIKKLFASIDHARLFNIIKRHIYQPDILWLTETVIDSFDSGIDRSGNSSKGVPIGNLTSQLFANIYLNELDQFLKHDHRVRFYLRYTDDFVIVHRSLYYLVDLRTTIDDFLQEQMNLSLHPYKVHLRKLHQGIDFLGYVILPNAIVLRTLLKRRIFKKVKQQITQFREGRITEETLLGSLHSYRSVLTHANTYKLRQKLDDVAGIVL